MPPRYFVVVASLAFNWQPWWWCSHHYTAFWLSHCSCDSANTCARGAEESLVNKT